MIEYPHTMSVDQTLKVLDSDRHGLDDSEVQKRLLQYGPNKIPESASTSILFLLLKQFKSWLIVILIIAAIISWITHQLIDAWVIISVIIINTLIGFLQEYKAEKAISALKHMIVQTAKVIRNGEMNVVTTESLVPGDIIVVEEGDSIPADARIIHTTNLRAIEASLTGESVPVAKHSNVLASNTIMAERTNMIWKGTFIAGGYGQAVVTGTGADTAIGEISSMIGNIKVRRTSFMQKTDILARQMSAIAIVSSVFIFIIGYFIRQFDIKEILLASIAALVAAVPEGLPAMISIVLAIGAKRMARHNVIIREFSATETLGAVTTIITDKTGTLTQNTLTVRKLFIPEDGEYKVSGEGWTPSGSFMKDNVLVKADSQQLHQLLKIAAISNNAEIMYDHKDKVYEIIGDPTEGALIVLARKGDHYLKSNELKLDDLPFDSSIKLRATLFQSNQKRELLVTGAPEKLLDLSENVFVGHRTIPMSKKQRSRIENKIASWSGEAMRVVAFAFKDFDRQKIDESELSKLTFVGLAGMIDPPRANVQAAIAKCKQAGIRVIMATGDHINTALAIAKMTGIVDEKHDKHAALTEHQLMQLSKDEFDRTIKHISVFARLTPKMKLKIAGRLQEMGQLIAMTGDGVNDAPALKQADVGISMGIMGTDVARNASDMVLTDDNFSSIVSAIEQGRIVFTNARQTSFFLTTTNIAESVTLLLAISLGFPMILTATQILWLNLVTDGVTDMALSTEQGHGGIMQQPPMKKSENILNRKILPFLFINVSIMTGLSLATFFYYKEQNIALARTNTFIVMAFTQLFNVYNLRSLEQSVFKIGLFSNRYINMAIIASALLLIAATEIPQLADILHFYPSPILEFSFLFLLSSLVLWAGEIYKYYKRKSLAY